MFSPSDLHYISISFPKFSPNWWTLISIHPQFVFFLLPCAFPLRFLCVSCSFFHLRFLCDSLAFLLFHVSNCIGDEKGNGRFIWFENPVRMKHGFWVLIRGMCSGFFLAYVFIFLGCFCSSAGSVLDWFVCTFFGI